MATREMKVQTLNREAHPAVLQALRQFDYMVVPDDTMRTIRLMREAFSDLALTIGLVGGTEATVALRDLRVAQDSAIRALIDKHRIGYRGDPNPPFDETPESEDVNPEGGDR